MSSYELDALVDVLLGMDADVPLTPWDLISIIRTAQANSGP